MARRGRLPTRTLAMASFGTPLAADPTSGTLFDVKLALALLLSACGGGENPTLPDAPPPPDTSLPTCSLSTVTGMVGGNTLVATSTLVLTTNLVEIVLTEGDGGCSGPPSSGQFLSLQLCPGGSLVGEHAIVNTVNCPASTVAALFIDGNTLNVATSGTVTVTSQADGCTSGSFRLTYPGNEQLEGSFMARACP